LIDRGAQKKLQITVIARHVANLNGLKRVVQNFAQRNEIIIEIMA
jgi:hypothetical protein